MLLSTLEAYDLLRFAEAYEARLANADELLASRTGMEREKGWMATAVSLVRTERAPAADMLKRVRDLPELEEVREEYAVLQQTTWVDALERLQAGITFCAGSRAPVIEALFPHLKFPQLRRASREAVIEFSNGYERRLKSSYVSRIFQRDDFAFIRPVLDQVAAAYAIWQSCFEPSRLSEERAIPLRQELIALGKRMDLAIRQARLLAEAALAPIPEAFESAGLAARPRRRTGRGIPSLSEGEVTEELTSIGAPLIGAPLEDGEPTVLTPALLGEEPEPPTLVEAPATPPAASASPLTPAEPTATSAAPTPGTGARPSPGRAETRPQLDAQPQPAETTPPSEPKPSAGKPAGRPPTRAGPSRSRGEPKAAESKAAESEAAASEAAASKPPAIKGGSRAAAEPKPSAAKPEPKASDEARSEPKVIKRGRGPAPRTPPRKLA